MIASRVHAVIAAGLENPHLLTLWRQDPNRLQKCGVDPDDLDLDALWKFAGLTAKVRHNGLRRDLPLTFRLLNVTGLEIEVFASYACFRAAAGAPYADTLDARAQDLFSFLEHWLDCEKHEHALLWDLIRHELALAQLSKLTTLASTVRSSVKSAPRAATIPRVCGEIILHEMRSDPREVSAKLHEKSPRLADLSPGAFTFCYWRRDATAAMHILQLDELGFYLLSYADGKRSAADLSQLLGGSRRPVRGLLHALTELAAVGILTLETNHDTARKQTR